jgi:flagellar motor switch protein FliM
VEPAQTPNDQDDVVWNDASPLSDLLGFDFGGEGGQDRSGLNALINSALVSHRRLPMLDIVFDRAARLMSTSLRQLTNENVETTLENVTSTRFSDFIESQSSSGIIGVIHSKGLDGYALLAADGALVHCVVDLLLGGRRGASAATEGRALTAIELGLAGRMLSMLARDVDEAFKPVKEAAFSLDRIETTPRFAAIVHDASVCALAKFKIRIDDFVGRAAILAPHATIEPIMDILARDFIGESRVADDLWRRRLSQGVASAGVNLEAVLADRVMTIGELEKLRPGDTLTFAADADRGVELRSGAAALAKGRVGRLGETIAVKLDAALNAEDVMRSLEAAA